MELNFYVQLLPTAAAVSAAAWLGSRLPIFEDRLLFASVVVAALAAGMLGSGEQGDKLIFILIAAAALAAVRAYRLAEGTRAHALARGRTAPGPLLRATTRQRGVYDDPSEDLLYRLMSDMEDGVEQYFAVQRLSDRSGQTYAQVFRGGDDWFLERRDGSGGRRFRAVFSDRGSAHTVLTAWTFELRGGTKMPTGNSFPAVPKCGL